MSLKRTYDDAAQDVSVSMESIDTGSCRAKGNDGKAIPPATARSPLSLPRSSLSNHAPSGSSGKLRQRSFDLDLSDDECVQQPSTSRPQALPRTARERFVPGLQTFVGGLQMSQSSASTSTSSTLSDHMASTTSGVVDPSDAIPPLVMSRNADVVLRTSQSAAVRRRSHEDGPERQTQQISSAELEGPLVPGVSPGWHVEAHGRQAMELQDGIRYQDEDGWTPLDAFPASTPQGKLIAKRARLRVQAQLRQLDAARRHSRVSSSASGDTNTMSPRSSPFLSSTNELGSSAPSTATTDTEMSLAPSTPPAPMPKDLDCVRKDNAGNCASGIRATERRTSPMSPSFPSSTSRPPSCLTKPEATPLDGQRQRNLPKSSFSLQDFEVLETLGTGTFGRVLLVHLRGRDYRDRTSYFALKVLAKTDVVRLKQVAHINSERTILGKVEHPFLVNMIATFQDSKNCYMLMEYVVGGEIFSYLRRAGHFSTDVARFYVSTIVLAIEYLHSQNIIYRDLKPENLLIDARGYTKITDFGFAKEVDERTWTLCGTPEYLAPEIIQCSGHGKAVDWWSLGILLFEMLAGYPPFYDPNPFGVYEKILQGKITFPEQIDPLSRDLITSLLTADRSKRLGNLRGGAQDVKNHAWFRGVDWQQLEDGWIRPPIIPYLGNAGDTSNFSKYESARHSALPGLYGLDSEISPDEDPHRDLFPDF